jgi:hypothetical protein
MEFTAPDKICPTCGKIIPANGYEMAPDGKMAVDELGRAVWHKRAELICETLLYETSSVLRLLVRQLETANGIENALPVTLPLVRAMTEIDARIKGMEAK